MRTETVDPASLVPDEVIHEALGRIPPLWPLKHFVAVNPFVGLLDQPFADACARLQAVTGSLPLLSGAEYRELWHRGEITQADLDEVADADWSSVRLLDLLTSDGPGAPRPVQTFADFIDERSEIFRRHLEASLPGLQSIGFAGFFGFPVAHETAPGEAASRCPVLLVPSITSCEQLAHAEAESKRLAHAQSDAWRAIQNSAASCFSFVETVGLGFIGTLNRPTSSASPACGQARPLSRLRESASPEERASRLAIETDNDEHGIQGFKRRATDISELRPEWALANNAAFIAAPRSRTAAHALDGRVFLHDYDESLDPDSRVLTLILCAPVVVASWINLQYYGSRVNPDLLGSGNKVLHNVVGGIGVVEGNGGDLRTGLPLQSLHDGERFVHEPRRLSVFIQAGTDRIDTVLRANPSVKQLFDHGWIHLFAFTDKRCNRYTPHGWIQGPCPLSASGVGGSLAGT